MFVADDTNVVHRAILGKMFGAVRAVAERETDLFDAFRPHVAPVPARVGQDGKRRIRTG